MAMDRLYELAVQFRKTKMWNRIFENTLFAVPLPGGGTGYCSVMGLAGDHIGLAVYPGAAGLQSFRSMCVAPPEEYPMAEAYFLFFTQECLQCYFAVKDELEPEELEEARAYAKGHGLHFRGTMAFPRFVRLRPYCIPFPVDSPEEEQILALGLDAALEVWARWRSLPDGIRLERGDKAGQAIPLLEREGDGFRWSMTTLPETEPEAYQSPALPNDILAGKLKRAKKNGTLACELLALPTPIRDDLPDGSLDIPRIGVTLMAIDCGSGKVSSHGLVKDFSTEAGQILQALAENLLAGKKPPQAICVRTDRTFAFLEPFCRQTGIQLKMDGDGEWTDGMDEIEEDMSHSSAEDGGLSSEELLDTLLLAIKFADKEQLKTMPPELKMLAKEMQTMGMLPPELERKMQRAFRDW